MKWSKKTFISTYMARARQNNYTHIVYSIVDTILQKHGVSNTFWFRVWGTSERKLTLLDNDMPPTSFSFQFGKCCFLFYRENSSDLNRLLYPTEFIGILIARPSYQISMPELTDSLSTEYLQYLVQSLSRRM